MNKKTTAALLLLLLTITFAACSGDTNTDISAGENTDNKLNVVATIFPQYDFSREIAGDAIDLTMLLTPGSESHSYEPSPQDIIKIQNADVFIYVGGETDQWVDKILSSYNNENQEVIALLDIIDAVEEEYKEGMQVDHDHSHDEDHDDHEHDDHEEHDDHDHDDYEVELDEHVWTSPKNAIEIVQYLSNVFISLDADNEVLYKENTENYIAKLTALDYEFEEIRANALRDTLIFADRFPFRYFADAYNLDYYAAFPGCSTETEPSAKTVAFLIDKVKEENIPYVFHIEFSNEKMADTICSETGSQKLRFHSCHNISRQDLDNGVSYLSLMKENAENLKEALY